MPTPNIPTGNNPPEGVTRREFLKKSAAAAAAAGLGVVGYVKRQEIGELFHGHDADPKLLEDIALKYQEQNGIYAEMADAETLQKFYDALPEKHHAFMRLEDIRAGRVGKKCACCSDEGNREVLDEQERPMQLHRSPGSRIPLDLGAIHPLNPEAVNRTARDLLRHGVKVVNGHAGCGAKKIVLQNYYRAIGRRDLADGLTPEDIDKFDRDFTEAVARQMKEILIEEGRAAEAEEIESGFIETLDRPKEFHVARSVILDDTGLFNAKFDGLPQAFVDTTENDDLEELLYGADELIKIAFDRDHGFGRHFGTERQHQFVVICVARNKKRLDDMMESVEKYRQKNLNLSIRNKVRVDGFVK